MRILVVEDEVKIRKGIASLINRHTEHTVIGKQKTVWRDMRWRSGICRR